MPYTTMDGGDASNMLNGTGKVVADATAKRVATAASAVSIAMVMTWRVLTTRAGTFLPIWKTMEPTMRPVTKPNRIRKTQLARTPSSGGASGTASTMIASMRHGSGARSDILATRPAFTFSMQVVLELTYGVATLKFDLESSLSSPEALRDSGKRTHSE
ncbi:hypothetical protein PF001_g15812 [Phytophthora fragariae]|uniref:Uncharacterized protein n=1 Tax=Phytophthora fragariae TaxID=53985 RepID=A0A6A4D6P3_9STRA|nr:hypothetical protein PF001_g15812 [Phytophthora fragariae]